MDPNDVVITNAVRTPIGKASRGCFKETHCDTLLSQVFNHVLKHSHITPKSVGDICVGNVLQPGAGGMPSRIAQISCGIPESVPLYTTNRFCSSGLQAVMNVAGSIRNGQCDMGIGAGVESMSLFSMDDVGELKLTAECFENQTVRDCLTPMGITSENVAEKFGITRKEQDLFAFKSQQKAYAAQRSGKFDDEIVPISITTSDGLTQQITKDEGIRPNTTLEGLARLRPAFKPDGSSTAGNSSQKSDGAAAVLLARYSIAKQLGLPVLGVIRSYAVVGVPPDIMGIGPAVAIPEALTKAGLSIDDIEVFEINEAFASQAAYCAKKLNIPEHKLNPNGGAIALGHPLGCTGARMVATLLHELKRRGRRSYGVVSMCIGSGMGAAAVLEFPGPEHHRSVLSKY